MLLVSREYIITFFFFFYEIFMNIQDYWIVQGLTTVLTLGPEYSHLIQVEESFQEFKSNLQDTKNG